MDWFDLTMIYLLFFSTAPFHHEQQPINYYEFALIKCPNNTRWTIHGLWPQHNDTSWPTDCHSMTNWDPNAIEPLREKLETDWPSCYNEQRNLAFWKHEWQKHGTCTKMSEIDYFNTTLMLYHQYYDSFFQYVCNSQEFFARQSHCIVPLPKTIV